MKLFLLSILVAQSLGALLIPREEYLKHTLFKDSDDRSPKCDDCCDEGVRAERGKTGFVCQLWCLFCFILFFVLFFSFFFFWTLFLIIPNMDFIQVPIQHSIRFFGNDYLKFWPCSNGVLSFASEVFAFGA